MRGFVTVISLSLVLAGAMPAWGQAPGDADDIVRLPGQGQVKAPPRHDRPSGERERLVPGGGLIVTFDGDANGRVTQAELLEGAQIAFLTADANEDGSLSAFEQIAWADQLPTRDDTLANPVRFDPNLDRMVSLEEFLTVVRQLAADYADSGSGDIILTSLRVKTPVPGPERDGLTRLVRRGDAPVAH